MYALKQADEGGCRCGNPLTLMAHKKMPDGYPAFLICWACRTVVEVKGDDGEVVQYKGGRRRRFTETPKHDKPKRPNRRKQPKER